MDLKVTELATGEARSDDPLHAYVGRFEQLQIIPDDIVRTLLNTSYMGKAGYEKIAEVVRQSVEDSLKVALRFVPEKTTFRRQGTEGRAKKSAFVPWHRDAHAVRTADLGNCLNCWVPLQSVGVIRPSLQIVVGSNNLMKTKNVDYDAIDNPSESDVIDHYGEDSICTAILEPGDFMVFDHHTLHRTQYMGDTYPTRVSGELRFQS